MQRVIGATPQGGFGGAGAAPNVSTHFLPGSDDDDDDGPKMFFKSAKNQVSCN